VCSYRLKYPACNAHASCCHVWPAPLYNNYQIYLKNSKILEKVIKHKIYSWFQTFALIRILYIFFWVFPRRQIVVGRRFGTLYQFHLQTVHPAFEDGTDTGFRNVCQKQFDAGEIPRRKYTVFICFIISHLKG